MHFHFQRLKCGGHTIVPHFSAARLHFRMNIGPYPLANNLFAAPMAGVTDRPFRQLCRKLGAGYAVS
jgi:hypothetical protein